MKICVECGKENQEHYKFCLGCGADLATAPVVSAGGPAAAVPEPKGGCVTLRIHVECERCAAPIPINGPAQRLVCKACLGENALPGLVEALHDASQSMRALGSRYDVTILEEHRPQCVACDASISIDTASSTTGVVPCARCGAGVPSYPAPAWLRATLPTAAWVFGGDPEVLPPESGVVLSIPEREAKPIAMACPQCSGGLTITKDNARIVPCRFCGVDVYLPDELWRRLHPVATKRAWTLTWSAPGLLTAEELKAREEAVRAADEAARRRAAAQRPASPPPTPPAPSSSRVLIVIAALALVATAIGIAVLAM